MRRRQNRLKQKKKAINELKVEEAETADPAAVKVVGVNKPPTIAFPAYLSIPLRSHYTCHYLMLGRRTKLPSFTLQDLPQPQWTALLTIVPPPPARHVGARASVRLHGVRRSCTSRQCNTVHLPQMQYPVGRRHHSVRMQMLNRHISLLPGLWTKRSTSRR